MITPPSLPVEVVQQLLLLFQALCALCVLSFQAWYYDSGMAEYLSGPGKWALLCLAALAIPLFMVWFISQVVLDQSPMRDTHEGR